MSSEIPPEPEPFDGDEEFREPPPPPEPTLYEKLVLHVRRIVIVITVTVLSVAAAVWGTQAILDVLYEIWPLFAGPILGWYFAGWTVRNLYRPAVRLIMVLDPETHTLRAVMIPEEIFGMFRQSGNNVVYHTPSGIPAYLARDLDLMTGEIDYGWVHELDPLEVMTREEAYVKWDGTLNEVLEENLQLLANPHIIGLGYARKSVRDNLDAIAEALGFVGKDYGAHNPVADAPPEPEDMPPGDEAMQ